MSIRRLVPTLTLVGAGLVLVSLVLTWSRQIPVAEHARFHGPVLFGVARNPTALQVYAVAGELLAGLAVWFAWAGLRSGPAVRLAALAGIGLGLGFVLHALAHPPTNGLLLAAGAGSAARYVTDPASAGAGETVALLGLLLGAVGLLSGLTRRRRDGTA